MSKAKKTPTQKEPAGNGIKTPQLLLPGDGFRAVKIRLSFIHPVEAMKMRAENRNTGTTGHERRKPAKRVIAAEERQNRGEATRVLDKMSRILNNMYNALVRHAVELHRQYEWANDLLWRFKQKQSSLPRSSQSEKRYVAKMLMLTEPVVKWLESERQRLLNDLRSPYYLRNIARGLKNGDSGPVLDPLYPRKENTEDPDRKAFAFWGSPYSASLADTAMRINRSIAYYFEGLWGKRPDKPGFPSFRRWADWKWMSIYWDGPGYVLAEDGRTLTLSFGTGAEKTDRKVTVFLDEPLPEKFPRGKGARQPSLRIVKELGEYFAVFLFKTSVEAKPLPPKPRVIAIDPHHINVAVLADNLGRLFSVPVPRFLADFDKGLDALQAKRDRAKRKCNERTTEDGRSYFVPSRRYRKLQQRMYEMRTRLQRRKDDWLEGLCNWLLKHFDLIVIGDYAPRGDKIENVTSETRRKLFNQSLLGSLRLKLQGMIRRSGKTGVILPEAHSSSSCSACEAKRAEPLPLKVQQWRCANCSCEHDRHENAARNLLTSGGVVLAKELVIKNPVPKPIRVNRRIVLVPDAKRGGVFRGVGNPG